MVRFFGGFFFCVCFFGVFSFVCMIACFVVWGVVGEFLFMCFEGFVCFFVFGVGFFVY